MNKNYDSNEKEINNYNKVLLSIYNNIKQGVCLHELIYKKKKPVDYKIIETNPAYEKILGISSDKAKGSLGSELYGDNKAPYLETYAQVAETGKSITIKEYFPPMDKYFNITVTSPEKGKFITLFNDITEKYKNRELLRRTKESCKKEKNFLTQILQTQGAMVVVLGINGKIVRYNKESEQVTGYSAQEVMGKSFWNIFIPTQEKEEIKKVFNEIKAKHFPYNNTNYWKTKEGKLRLISWKNTAITDEDGEVEYIIATGIDVTERRQRIKQLQEQKEELSAANQQLTSYSEEITAMNEELDDSVKEVNELNKRLVNMINAVSSLDKKSRYDEEIFLSDLLHSAINIVPEADYGKICVIDEDDKCEIIDAVGHDCKFLKENRLSKSIFFHHGDKGVYTSEDYSLDIDRFPDNLKEQFEKSLKPINKSIYINITVNNEFLGRISLDIAEESNKEFSETTKHILKSFATLASSFFYFQRYNKLQSNFTKELITSIIQILEMYDRYTSGHSESVADIASNIAQKIGLSKNEIKDTYWAGMVHDIGKLLVPLRILNKDEALTDSEYELIKKHPYWGYKALSKSDSLKHIAKYVLHHHERWDGSGYPDGLKGNKIPLISQILAVADAWDAMTSKRAYRESLSKKETIQEIKDNKGKQFSPKVAEVFLKSNVKM